MVCEFVCVRVSVCVCVCLYLRDCWGKKKMAIILCIKMEGVM